MPIDPPEPPPYMEALAVYGWAVEHGGIPLAYAVDVLADHGVHTHTGLLDRTERLTLATEDLWWWEDVVVDMDWPSDKAIDEEQWHRGAYWRLEDYIKRRAAGDGLRLPGTGFEDDLRSYLDPRIADCDARPQQSDSPTDRS